MNKRFQVTFWFFAFGFFAAHAQRKPAVHHFLLNGTIDGQSDGVVYVRYLGIKDKFTVDSSRLHQGHFSIKGLINGPTIAFIGTSKKAIPDDEVMEADGKSSTLFFLEPKTITASLRATDFKNGSFTGSASQSQFAGLNHQTTIIDSLYKAGMDSLKTTAPVKSEQKDIAIHQLSQHRETEKAAVLRQFFDHHPNSYVTAYLVSISHFKLDTLKLYYNRLSVTIRKSSYGEDILENIEKKQRIAIGHQAPNFVQKTADSSEVSLKDFRGKYVLLLFWSTSSNASRNLNKDMVSVYNRFKDKNFMILGASLDGEKTRKVWQNAIAKDGLPWKQLMALKSNHNPAAIAYDVESLPSTFLINPQGKIIAVGLNAVSLDQQLEVLR